jgi:VanZ family protein
LCDHRSLPALAPVSPLCTKGLTLKFRGFIIRVKVFLKYWLPVLIWLGFIFIGSTDLMSAEHTSRFLIPFLHWLKPDFSPEALAQVHFVLRKLGHVTEYAILAMLFWRALRRETDPQIKAVLRLRSGQTLFLSVWILCAIFAATDEFHQSFVPSRGAAWSDVMIDSAGAIFGLLISARIARGRDERSGKSKVSPGKFKA